jgi:hypothetical protein
MAGVAARVGCGRVGRILDSPRMNVSIPLRVFGRVLLPLVLYAGVLAVSIVVVGGIPLGELLRDAATREQALQLLIIASAVMLPAMIFSELRSVRGQPSAWSAAHRAWLESAGWQQRALQSGLAHTLVLGVPAALVFAVQAGDDLRVAAMVFGALLVGAALLCVPGSFIVRWAMLARYRADDRPRP